MVFGGSCTKPAISTALPKKLNYLSQAYPLQTPSWVETSSLLLISFALHFVVSPGKLTFLSQSGLEMGCPEAPILIATAKLTLETETMVLTTRGPHAYSGEMYEEWICCIQDIPYCLSYQHYIELYHEPISLPSTRGRSIVSKKHAAKLEQVTSYGFELFANFSFWSASCHRSVYSFHSYLHLIWTWINPPTMNFSVGAIMSSLFK